MSSSSSAPQERLRLDTKFFFGIGSAAESIALFAVGSYAMLFYNQVLGLNAGLAGLAVAASLCLDGFADPVVGSLSDRTKSRFGRRHGYMYFAPIPIGLCLIAVFHPPAEASQWLLFTWFCLSVTALRISMTFFHTPHLALGGELSRDYIERSKVLSWNNFFTWAGAAGMSFFALRYVFKATPEYPRGLLNPEPYGPFSVGCALAAMAILFGSAFFTRDQIARLPKPPENLPKFSPFEFLKDLGRALQNRNYLWLLIAYFFLSLMIGLRGGLNVYVNTFFWQLTSEQLSLFVIGSFAGYASGFLFSAKMHGKFDKRVTMIVWALVYAIGPALPMILGLTGVLTPSTPGLLWILIAFSVTGSAGASILGITVMSALADIADQNELKYGLRQEGVLYSTRALASKVDQALGAGLAGLALTMIAFPERAKPGEVPQETIWNLAACDGVLAAIPGIIAAVFYARYGISKAKYEETKSELALRRASLGQPAPPPVLAAADLDGDLEPDLGVVVR